EHLRVRAGEEPGRGGAGAARYDRAAGALAGGRRHRERGDEPRQGDPDRQQRKEGTQGQADGHGRSGRYGRCSGAILLMSDIRNFDPSVKLRFEEAANPEDAVLRAPGEAAGGGYASYPDIVGGSGEGGEPHLLDYVRVLYKRRWIAGTAFTVVMLLVTVYTFTVTPIYQATTKLLIESDSPNVVSFKEVINEEQTKADYYQTQYNILQSRSLARRTLETLKLWESGEFVTNKRGIVQTLAGGVASLFGKKAPEPGIPDAGETSSQSRAVDAFLKRLTVSPVRNRRIAD